MTLAEKETSYDSKQNQQSKLRRHRDTNQLIPTSKNGSFPERQLKSSKSSKSSKGTKSSKSSKSMSKSNKTTKSTKSNDQDVSPTMAPTIASTMDPIYLDGIIASVVESNDFSSYIQEDFDVAKTWFLNPSNHRLDGEIGDEYMKERFILALIYSSNCGIRCSLRNWLSATDHCEWPGVSCNESKEISKLIMKGDNLRGKGLTGKFTLFGMSSLKVLNLESNILGGTFTVAGESKNLNSIVLWGNGFSSFVGGGILSNLKNLSLGFNNIAGDFIITPENFPTSMKHLNLSGNGLTGFRGAEILPKLERLNLARNEFEGDFIVEKENFAKSIKNLSLEGNKLTDFVGGGVLTNLQFLLLGYNDFAGDFVMTSENFPTSIKNLSMYENKLTSIDAEPGVGSNLEFLQLSFQNNDNEGIMVKDELCNRRPELIISPSNACSLGRMPPAYLESIITSVVESNDFSSYNEDDFNDAKSWFLNPSNHLVDNDIGDEYMKERFILALTYSANCKEGCALSNWLSGKDHCKWWQGIECNSSKSIYEISCKVGCRLSGEFTLFGMKSLETLKLFVPFYISSKNPSLSGTFTVAGASENLRDLSLTNNKLTGFVGGAMLTNLENLDLNNNEFVGDFIIDEENFPTSIKRLDLRGNKLIGFFGGGILTNLESLWLHENEFVGDFIINEQNFPKSIKGLGLAKNKLTGFSGGGILTNLEGLSLNDNEVEGDLIIDEENFPTSIKTLRLYRNKLTSFVGGGILTNLETLQLYDNVFAGDLMITAENFPTSIKTLELFGNKLTSFEGGGILTNLETLRLQDNELNGDLMITAENFPPSIKEMNLSDNKLTSIDADSDAVLDLSLFYVSGNWGTATFTLGDELCSRPDLFIPAVWLYCT